MSSSSGSREWAMSDSWAWRSWTDDNADRRDGGLSGRRASEAGFTLSRPALMARAYAARVAWMNASSAPTPWRDLPSFRASSPARRAQRTTSCERTSDASSPPAQEISRRSGLLYRWCTERAFDLCLSDLTYRDQTLVLFEGLGQEAEIARRQTKGLDDRALSIRRSHWTPAPG